MIISLLARLSSANTATVRCVAQQDQISVYDSLRTRGVEAKLKCGEEVEIIGRVQHYVKIRAHNGVEGYVPDNSFAALPRCGRSPGCFRQVSSVAVTPAQNTTRKNNLPASLSRPPHFRGNESCNSSSPPLPEHPPKQPAAAPATQPAGCQRDFCRRPSPPLSIPMTLPLRQPENESADPACQNYFSAYGLAPSQMKWIAQNRKKLFSNVCPAPDIAKVDYVMIFTHDVDFFNVTMPTPVHKIEGFSDFRALTPIDTGLTSASDPDKAHRQYVWIFRFAPALSILKISRRAAAINFPQSNPTPLGSKAGLKAVEDAFRFVSTANH